MLCQSVCPWILGFPHPPKHSHHAVVPRWPTLARRRSRGRRMLWSGGSVRAAEMRACSRASLPPLLITYWILRPVPREMRASVKGFDQSIFAPEPQLLVAFNLHDAYKGLPVLFYCYKLQGVCRFDLLGAPKLEMWLMVVWWNHCLCFFLFQRSLLLQTCVLLVFHCALKCSREE